MGDNKSMEVVKKTLKERKSLGMFFTPLWLVDYMTSLIDINGMSYDRLKVLEPACGTCQFLRRVRDKFKYLDMDCVGVE
ncbi:MAG: SAM-dependent methyltransferase, partial [Brevinematales bacterium]|nr:SAM-dependent methyltransferase [Brevinematales bacterium]